MGRARPTEFEFGALTEHRLRRPGWRRPGRLVRVGPSPGVASGPGVREDADGMSDWDSSLRRPDRAPRDVVVHPFHGAVGPVRWRLENGAKLTFPWKRQQQIAGDLPRSEISGSRSRHLGAPTTLLTSKAPTVNGAGRGRSGVHPAGGAPMTLAGQPPRRGHQARRRSADVAWLTINPGTGPPTWPSSPPRQRTMCSCSPDRRRDYVDNGNNQVQLTGARSPPRHRPDLGYARPTCRSGPQATEPPR